MPSLGQGGSGTWGLRYVSCADGAVHINWFETEVERSAWLAEHPGGKKIRGRPIANLFEAATLSDRADMGPMRPPHLP